jgi:hypothetical protein
MNISIKVVVKDKLDFLLEFLKHFLKILIACIDLKLTYSEQRVKSYYKGVTRHK